jgi:exodeoxyribonuclease-3
MILATWNVNGVRARATRLAEWLAERKPDVVCLQELKVKEDEFSHDVLEASGYKAALVGQQGWNGVAVIAREQPEPVLRALPGAPADAGARFVTARVAGLEVASVYVPNGKTTANPEFKTKLAWLEHLAAHFEKSLDAKSPLLLAGDFNVCWTDLDSYLGARGRGAIFHTDEERATLDRLTASGLVDLYRSLHADEPGYSWWDYRAGAFHRKLGMRLDLLLATPPVARRVKEVFVDREFRKKSKTSGALPSDHAPVVAVLAD